MPKSYGIIIVMETSFESILPPREALEYTIGTLFDAEKAAPKHCLELFEQPDGIDEVLTLQTEAYDTIVIRRQNSHDVPDRCLVVIKDRQPAALSAGLTWGIHDNTAPRLFDQRLAIDHGFEATTKMIDWLNAIYWNDEASPLPPNPLETRFKRQTEQRSDNEVDEEAAKVLAAQFSLTARIAMYFDSPTARKEALGLIDVN